MTLLLSLAACIWVSDDEVTARQAKLLDFDEDGYDGLEWGGEDCDDFDPSVHPGKDETPYDGVDNDCDADTPDDDIDGDGFDVDNDCDDEDLAVHPGATEVCDGADNDCNDQTDEGVKITVYADSDGDGYGDPDVSEEACEVGEDQSDNGLDCDDEDPELSPEASEVCDGVDNDCDELVDDDDTPVDPTIFYEDSDDDGYGTGSSTTTACELPEGYATNASDCNDQDTDVHPGGLERLGDSEDGDCYGDEDSFEFEPIDTRQSAYVRGPEVSFTSSSLGDEIHVGWSAVTFDEGSGELHDGKLASTWDPEDPFGAEADFYADGSGSSLGTTGEAADFLASDEYFFWVRNFDDSPDGRIFQIDVLDRNTGGTSAVGWQQTGVNTLFDDLQIGFSSSQNVTAVGCSTRGGGMELAQIHLSYLISGNTGAAWHAYANTLSHSRCDYDDGATYGIYSSTGRTNPPLDIIYRSQEAEELYVEDSWSTSSYTIPDLEFTWQHDVLAFAVARDYSSSSDSVLIYGVDLAGSGSFEVEVVPTAEAMTTIDVSPAPSGEIYACGVGADGSVWLLMADPIASGSTQAWELDTGGLTADECALAATAADLLAVALREGDDLYLGWVGI